MFQINLKSGFIRTFILLLSFLLLFCCVGRPLVAQASIAATVAIGAYGVTKVVISAKVLIGLIIGSFTGFLLEPLLNETDEWYESNTAVRNWADQYNGRITGGEIVSIPSEVQNAIREKYDVAVSVDLSTLYVPYDLTHLENVSAVHVFGTDFAAQLEANNSLLLDIKGALNTLKTSIVNLPSGISASLASSFNSVTYAISSLQTKVSDFGFALWGEIGNVTTNIQSMSLSLQTNLGMFNSNVQDMSLSLQTDIGMVNDNIKDMSLSLQHGIGRIETAINDRIEAMVISLGNLTTKVDELVDVITTPQVVTKPEVEVQVGTQTMVVSDYLSLGNAFGMKLSWIPQIFNFLKELFNRIVYTGEPPKVSIPLTASTGKLNFSSDVIIDMSWYEPYKPYGDTIISGFLWLGFGWNLYKRTPSILNGIGISQEPVASGVGKGGKKDD